MNQARDEKDASVSDWNHVEVKASSPASRVQIKITCSSATCCRFGPEEFSATVELMNLEEQAVTISKTELGALCRLPLALEMSPKLFFFRHVQSDEPVNTGTTEMCGGNSRTPTRPDCLSIPAKRNWKYTVVLNTWLPSKNAANHIRDGEAN